MNTLQYVLLTMLFVILSISLTSNFFLYQQIAPRANNAGMLLPVDYMELSK